MENAVFSRETGNVSRVQVPLSLLKEMLENTMFPAFLFLFFSIKVHFRLFQTILDCLDWGQDWGQDCQDSLDILTRIFNISRIVNYQLNNSSMMIIGIVRDGL